MVRPSLVLYPVQAVSAWAWQALPARLAALELIGIAQAPEQFGAGAQLWEWVCLLGCAPVWQQPPELHFQQFPETRFWLSNGMPPPRCPQCRTRFLAALAPYAAAPGSIPQWACVTCGAVAAATAWKLGRYAVVASQWLALTPVYPGEAVPAEALLAQLATLTERPWDYAYAGLCQTAT